MHEQPHIDPRRAARPIIALALIVAAATTAAGVWADAIAPIVALIVAGVIAVAFAFSERRAVGRADGPLDISGLAAAVDRHRHDGVIITPVAAIVIELRGVAADTIVDGAAAWAEPIGVVVRRLTSASVVEDMAVARLGPHTFGAVVATPTRDDALLAAESLVSLCRVPVRTRDRELRIDAVAGVSHVEVGERCSGEELIRAADASLRVDQKVVSPIVAIDSRLRAHARRVLAVESEIRRSLDTDLLTARLLPIVDVHRDEVAGLRTAYDWTSISSTDPEILGTIADSLGLRRSIETQYLMRSIAAAESMPMGEGARRVVASMDAHRLSDPRAVSQISLLLRVCGLEPEHLVLELDCWSAAAIDAADVRPLRDLGVGIGVALGHRGRWDELPSAVVDGIQSVSVSATDVMHADGLGPELARIESLRTLCTDLSLVTVREVNSASTALELSAAGLPLQSGVVHGSAMDTSRLKEWMADRHQ